jgi:glycosyltransferase involved in cell wall biosynthesis
MFKKLRIAQIANNWGEFIPEKAIGISAVVRDVSLGLTARGHDVTVFAPNGSIFPGVKLRCAGKTFKDLGINLFHPDAPFAQATYVKEIISQLHDFDIIHSHVEHVMLPFIQDISIPVVSTVHGASFMPREKAIFQEYPDKIFIALSQGAKLALPYIHFSYVVHNGISLSETIYNPNPQVPSCLVWMGRFSENKGVLDAIEAAKKANEVLKLAGFKEANEDEYFEKVKHLIDGSRVQFVGQLGKDKKYGFLSQAKAMLFPIHWEEPFGLVMAESMACGTPVVAYNRGSVSDVIKDGVTGFIIDQNDDDRQGKGTWVIKKQGIDGLIEAIRRIGEISRENCRKHVEANFTLEKMTGDYEKVYENVLEKL